MSNSSTRKLVIVFLVLTCALSAIFWVCIARAGMSSTEGSLYTAGLMWCPGIAALLTAAILQRNLRSLGWRFGKVRYLLVSYVLPIGYAAVVYGLTWVLGWGKFTVESVPAEQSLLGFVLDNATWLFLLGGLLPALGEEIGWRGFMVPQLAKLTSFTNVALISGAIWAVWHYPLLLFADYHTDTPRWFAVICFTVLAMGISFPLAWLRLRSGSLWPAAILHASHNIYVQGVFDLLTENTGWTAYVTTEFGVGLAAMAVIVALFFWRQRHSVQVAR